MPHPLLSFSATAVHLCRHHLLLPPPSASAAAVLLCCRRLSLSPPSASVVAVRLCCCLSLPLPSVSAVAVRKFYCFLFVYYDRRFLFCLYVYDQLCFVLECIQIYIYVGTRYSALEQSGHPNHPGVEGVTRLAEDPRTIYFFFFGRFLDVFLLDFWIFLDFCLIDLI